MAVVAVWKCDRDGAMFDNKKDAEVHDKMLEFAEDITLFLKNNINNIDDELGQKVGLLCARHRDDLAKACKGRSEHLRSITSAEETETTEQDDDGDNVAPLVAGQ